MLLRFLQLVLLGLLFSHGVFAIEPAYEGPDGIRAKVFTTNCLFCHSSNLSNDNRKGAPSGLNWDVYKITKKSGARIIVRAVDFMTMPPTSSGIPKLNQNQKDALLAWQQAGFPEEALVANASFDFENLVLTLPVVHVGEEMYEATLKLVNRPENELGFGFELLTAILVTIDTPTAAVFDVETGLVQMPIIDLLNSDASSSSVSAEMVLVPATSPLIFDLTEIITFPSRQRRL